MRTLYGAVPTTNRYGGVNRKAELARRLTIEPDGGADLTAMRGNQKPDAAGPARTGTVGPAPTKPTLPPVAGPQVSTLGQPLTAPAQHPYTAPPAIPPPGAAVGGGGPQGVETGAGSMFGKGGGMGMKGINRGMARLFAGNAAFANPLLWEWINRLQQQAEAPLTGAEIASRMGPALQMLNRAEEDAAGEVRQDLAARGLEDGGYAEARQGAMQGAFAGQRANLAANTLNFQQQRQDAAAGDLRSLLLQIVSGGRAGADIGLRLRELMNQEGQAGFGFGDALAGLGPILGRIKF